MDNNLLVAGEQERWGLEIALTKKGHESGPKKPDILVETFDPHTGSFSDLIFCEAKRPVMEGQSGYENLLNQIASTARQKKTTTMNEHVFACTIHGPWVSFFMFYDDVVSRSQSGLNPICPDLNKEELENTYGAHPYYDEENELLGCEFNLLDKKSERFAHVCFIHMSSLSGPIDPLYFSSDEEAGEE